MKKVKKRKRRRKMKSSQLTQRKTTTKVRRATTQTRMKISRAHTTTKTNFRKKDCLGMNLTREPKRMIEERQSGEAEVAESFPPSNLRTRENPLEEDD